MTPRLEHYVEQAYAGDAEAVLLSLRGFARDGDDPTTLGSERVVAAAAILGEFRRAVRLARVDWRDRWSTQAWPTRMAAGLGVFSIRSRLRRDGMSDQGWQEFLAAEGIDDWVGLHGGAAAVFRVGSLVEAARLAEAVAGVATEPGILMTVASDRLTVRLTRDNLSLEARHAEVARAVSAVARSHGAVADRGAVQEVQLAIAGKPDSLDVGFWRAVLGYLPMADDNAVDPLGHGSTVWMQELDPARPLRHAMHVDVSVAREHAEERLAAAVAAGGTIVDDSWAPRWWTLSDRAGNRVCIAAWPDGAGLSSGATTE